MGCVTLHCTGGFGHNGIIVMSFCRNLFVDSVSADRTGRVNGAIRGAGGFSHNGIIVMSFRKNRHIDNISAGRTGRSNVTMFDAGRIRSNNFVGVTLRAFVGNPSDGSLVVLHFLFSPGVVIGRIVCGGGNKTKRILAKFRGVTRKTNLDQIITSRERPTANGGDTVANRHDEQTAAFTERPLANLGNAIRDDNTD